MPLHLDKVYKEPADFWLNRFMI